MELNNTHVKQPNIKQVEIHKVLHSNTVKFCNERSLRKSVESIRHFIEKVELKVKLQGQRISGYVQVEMKST